MDLIIMNKVFLSIIKTLSFWSIEEVSGQQSGGDLVKAYNKITDIIFLYITPIVISLACVALIFSVIKAGIKIGSAKTGEEKEAGKKSLGWSLGGIAIIVSSQFIIPLIVKGIFQAVSK